MPNPKLGDLTSQMTRFLQQINNRVGEKREQDTDFKRQKRNIEQKYTMWVILLYLKSF